MRDRVLALLRGLVPYALVVQIAGAVALVLDATVPVDRRGIELRTPHALGLLGGCALLAWVGFHLRVGRAGAFAFSRVGDLAVVRRGLLGWLAPAPQALRVVAVGLVALALAQPRTFRREVVEIEGIDIMVVLDLSKSMEERDLRQNRLDAARRTIRAFLRGRQSDRIGLVVFAKQAMLQCPLTLDYGALDTIVGHVAIGDIDPMGTAIGDGLGLAVAALRRSDARSKVVILLTDGDSNVNNVMGPEDARAAARQRGVRVFTVLMGSETAAGLPADPYGRQPYATNPALLRDIAAATGGRFFRAGDTEALERGFEEVRATLEKSKRREVRRLPTELFPALVTPALGLLLLEILLALTRFRRFP